jgi:di/tricarboxylate transporter
MTLEIASVLLILVIAVAFLVMERVAMEVVALLVLSVLAVSGLVPPSDALSGFSNPAVVTVWAVFILSGALTRTGVGDVIGHRVLRLAGHSEWRVVVVIMLSAGVLSAFMNNVAVAALMLPVTMDIARRAGLSPSRLLLPLAYGSLLGGLTTLIGTPPNILVSDALRDGGLAPFRLFDYTPVGVVVMAAGVAFMALVGRHLLPRRDVGKAASALADLERQYELHERMFCVRLLRDSTLVGRTLAESRLGSALGLEVVGIVRGGKTELAPDSQALLQADDRLLVEGRMERLNNLPAWRQLTVEEEEVPVSEILRNGMEVGLVDLVPDSRLQGRSLLDLDFRTRFGLTVLALVREGKTKRTHLQGETLQSGDSILVHGPAERIDALAELTDLGGLRRVLPQELVNTHRLHERLLKIRLPQETPLAGMSIRESRLGDALGLRVLGILREGEEFLFPEVDSHLQAGDRLIVEGRAEDFAILRGIEGLLVEQEELPDLSALESDRFAVVEAALSPRTTLAGKTLRQLHFREKYGFLVLALWREGRAYRTNLRDMALKFGDALLLLGPREKQIVLGRDPDFLVLTQAAQELPRSEKARTASLVMAGVVLPVIVGLVPIYVSAVMGAAVMVLTRCLTMEEAYRAIEWKAVFLIAGMLPLGDALERTGAARLMAEGLVAALGPMGPMALLVGLVAVTFAATCFVPTAALVVLMAPIVLDSSARMGISPHALMMGVAMAASASFTTPVAHPANVLVMGPGGYRFLDYLKVGGAMTLVVLAVLLVILPRFWPLQ